MENEDLAAGKQSAVHFKGRIFRGRADEDDAALFHNRQKGVMLGFVEAVYFIHENDGPSSAETIFFRLLHDGADLFDAAGHGGEVDEV